MTDNIDERRFWDTRTPAAIAARVAADRATVAAMDAEQQAINAARLAEWTRETTIARRAEWNARVTSGEFHVRGKFFPAKAAAAQDAQGWRVEDLKAAVASHGL